MGLGGEALAYARRLGDPGILMEALFLPVVTLTYRGEFAGAREHSALALAMCLPKGALVSVTAPIGARAVVRGWVQ